MTTIISLYHKSLILIYIIAIPIPFGIVFILFLYSILFYVFKLPLKKERDLLMSVVAKIRNLYSKKLIPIMVSKPR